jgi:hypothetical protein
MPIPLTAAEVLNREFLETRCKILELAAALDRLDRADGSTDDDPRMTRVRDAIELLLEPAGDRAERVQMTFSREYDEAWQQTLKVAPRS